MRQIKFRTYVRFLREMHEVREIILDRGAVMIDSYQYGLDKDDAPVMQFTGLKDVNGVDIYEGDILIIWIQGDKQTSPYVVEDMCQLYSDNNRDDAYYQITKMEVIGNIHQHHELLEKK